MLEDIRSNMLEKELLKMSSKTQNFINKIHPYAVQDMKQSGVLASLTIAQAILESGWGESQLAKEHNNLFGIKKGSGWSGETVSLKGSEWRVYDSWLGSIKDHSELLQKPRYEKVLKAKDYKVVCEEVRLAGYCPESDYSQKLIRLIEQYDLAKYDSQEQAKGNDSMANKILALDAGHGLNTSGKQTLASLGKVYKEWTLNDSVVRKITAILGDYNVTIHRTDDPTGKTDVSLNERVKRCNKYNPHLFVSIHHNAGGGTGTEVYYHSQGTAEDKKVANILAPKLASKCGMKNRGVKHAQFAVLTCKSTAILIEGGFMDTQSDYNFITTDKGQQAYAQAVAESIIEYLGLTKVKNTSSSSTTSENKTKPVQSVEMVNTNKKVKIVKDVNVWCDVEWKNVKAQAKKGSIYHVTKQTKDGNFFFIEGGYVSTSSEFSLASALEVAPYNKIMAIRDCSLFTYCDGKHCIGNIKEWEVYETIDYKDGWYLIFGLGWVHESHVKTYPVTNIACTNGIV